MSASDDGYGIRLSRADVPWLTLLCLLISFLYVPQFFGDLTAMDAPHLVDVTGQWYPGYTMGGEYYREGLFPLWYKERFGGMPWLGITHGGGIYPTNVLFFTALSFFNAATASHLFHGLVAGLGLYLFLRGIRVSPPASFMGALVYLCAGFFFYLQSQLSNHATVAWAPLLLLFLRSLLLRPGLFAFLGASAVTCMMFLGGDPEGFTYFGLLVFFFILFFIRQEKPGHLLKMLFIAGSAMTLGLILSSAQVLVLLELVSHSIRSSASPFDLTFGRLVETRRILHHLVLPWNDFLSIHPRKAFNNGLTPFYMGAVPLLFFIYAFKSYRKDPKTSALLNVALAILIFLVIRKFRLFDPVVSRIPVISSLATVERSLQMIQLAGVMAAAAAFDRFTKEQSRRWTIILSSALVLTGSLSIGLAHDLTGAQTRYAAGALMLIFGFAGMITAWKRALSPRIITTAALVLVLADLYVLALFSVPRTDTYLFRIDPSVKRFIDNQDKNYRFIPFITYTREARTPDLPGLITAETGLDSPFGVMRLPLWRYFEFLHLIDPAVAKDWHQAVFRWSTDTTRYFVADLYNPAFLNDDNLHLLNLLSVRYVFARGPSFKFSSPFSLMNEQALVKGDWLEWPRENASFARFHRDQGRRALTAETPYRVEFESYVYPGTVMAFEVKPPVGTSNTWRVDVRVLAGEAGADELTLLSARRLEAEHGKNEEFSFVIPLIEWAGKNTRFLIEIATDEPKARVVIIDARLAREDAPFQRVAPGPVDIFINTNALPRAFVAHEARVLSKEELLQVMTDPAVFDPGHMVLFERGDVPEHLVALTERGPPRRGEPVLIKQHGRQKIIINTRTASPGWLLLADPYFPGWRAWVDGTELQICRADMVLRALFLTEGGHEIEFSYQPASFRVGLWMSLATIVSVCVVGCAYRFVGGVKRNRLL